MLFMTFGKGESEMINYQKDDFDGSFEDIMNSINNILNNTGEGYETEENIEEEDEMLKKKNEKINRNEV